MTSSVEKHLKRCHHCLVVEVIALGDLAADQQKQIVELKAELRKVRLAIEARWRIE